MCEKFQLTYREQIIELKLSCNECSILRISILTNILRIITIISTFDTKRGAMGISAIDGAILKISS